MSIMRNSVVAATLCGLLIVPMGSAFAQTNTNVAQSAGPGWIRLDVAVTTKKGAPAADLSAKDFTVLDNKSQGSIASFKAVNGEDSPVEVVIVVDSVNTPYQYLAYQRDQIARYLRSNGGKLQYPTTFAVLTDTSFKIYKSSKDGNELADALDHTNIGLRTMVRSQGFWGAMDRMTVSQNALRSLATAELSRPGRKLVLWVSPGWPLMSGPWVYLDDHEQQGVYRNVVALSQEMRVADITLYNINSWGADEGLGREFFYQNFLNGLKGPNDAQWGNLSLQVLAAQSGGLVLNSNDVVAMMQQCVADANRYYRIVLNTPADEKPNAYHKIEVKLAQNGLVARTRTGFYSEP